MNELGSYLGGGDDNNEPSKWTTKAKVVKYLIYGGVGLAVAGFTKLLVSVIPSPTDILGMILSGALILTGVGVYSYLWYQRKAIKLWVRAKAIRSEERIIGSDPTGIMRAQLSEIRNALTKSRNSITKLESVEIEIKSVINENKKEAEKRMDLAAEYRKRGEEQRAVNEAEIASLAEQQVLDFQPQLQSVVAAKAFLNKLIEGWDGDVKYLESLIKTYEQKLKITGSVANAIGSMDELTGEGSDGRRIFVIATEQAQKQMADRVANIKQFMSKNKAWIDAKDGDAIIRNMRGKKMLTEYLEKSEISSLTGISNDTKELEKVLANSSLSQSAQIASKKFEDLN